MKKGVILGVVAAAAAGTVGWLFTADRRKNRVELVRREARRLLAIRRDELKALRTAAEAGELPSDALGPVPLEGAAMESVRVEDGAVTVTLSSGEAVAWVSSQPMERLEVPVQPWKGNAHPGVLYTEQLGEGWFAGYACRRWS